MDEKQFEQAFAAWWATQFFSDDEREAQFAAWLACYQHLAPQWQPIETAPKTGRTILLGYPNRLGNWRTVRGQWMSEQYIADYWEDSDDVEEGWFETSEEAEETPNCWRISPTHWMPLPAAPEAAREQEKKTC